MTGHVFFPTKHQPNKNRIWELDALRGICILGMVVIHFIYDLVEVFGILQWLYPPAFLFLQHWGGSVFFIISGICATRSKHSLRRGLLVLFCGLLCTAVTASMYLLDFADRSILIYFGVLHCLGCCMVLWPAVQRLSAAVLGVISFFVIAAGLYLRAITPASSFALIPFGILPPGFVSSDYFPLLPYWGVFLLGSILGRILYSDGISRFPKIRADRQPLKAACFLGRHSLGIYLFHQPVLFGLVLVVSSICR